MSEFIEGRFGDWMAVQHAGRFWPLDPRPKEIDIRDVAGALAKICRFGGHTRAFFPVASHSLLVSHYCEPEDALWGLLHDAAEAYLGDMIRPIKRYPGMSYFETAEERVMWAVCHRFGLSFSMPESVRYADELLLATEGEHLMGADTRKWRGHDRALPEPLSNDALGSPASWKPETAERLFLERFAELYKERE